MSPELKVLLMSALLIAAGLYFGMRNYVLLKNEKALREYMETSPKAVRWVHQYGIDRATSMARETAIPFGIVISIIMVAAGAWFLVRLYI